MSEIKAYLRMEERYEGLNLVFGDHPELKRKIFDAIDQAKEKTGKNPFVFETVSQSNADIQSIYIEFNDDYHQEAGEFFEIVLHKLGIKCEDETC